MKRLLLVAMIAACDKRTERLPIGDDTKCGSDTDCELVNGVPPDCCSACSPDALNKPAVAEATLRCNEIAKDHPDYFARCPHLDCPCGTFAAKCQASHCVVESTPCSH